MKYNDATGASELKIAPAPPCSASAPPLETRFFFSFLITLEPIVERYKRL